MKSIFVTFLFLSLVLSCFGQASIDCVYSTTIVDNVDHYVCNLELVNPDGADDFTNIPGEHIPGRTNDQVTFITNYHGSTPIVPHIICEQFPNLEFVNFVDFGLTTITDTAFSGCENLRNIELFNNRISSVSAGAFVNNRNASFIDLGENQLTSLPEGVFASQQNLEILELINNPFEENFPAGTFSGLVNLRMLLINNCRLTAIHPQWFADLESAFLVNLQGNQILEVPEDAFVGLASLNILNLNNNFIQTLHGNSFRGLSSLVYIFLEENQISELPSGVFTSFDSINYIDLRQNRIKTVSRDAFGPLANLGTLDLDFNVVNAMDERIFEEATALNLFYFGDNLCASGFFNNFLGNRDLFLARLARCFRNFQFTVDTTTEAAADYRFFEAPAPGIQLRVTTTDEVHIALTPFDFPWQPMLEIIIGAANNTRSIIRRNQEEDAAVVPTPGIINGAFSNGFRVTWANHILLVLREGDQFPFLAFTMRDFFNVNFYGLRTQTGASWTIQPVDADDRGISPASGI